jgi:hypothetical protein
MLFSKLLIVEFGKMNTLYEHNSQNLTMSRITGLELYADLVYADLAESSTAPLKALRSAVSCIFSLPPVESRCLEEPVSHRGR